MARPRRGPGDLPATPAGARGPSEGSARDGRTPRAAARRRRATADTGRRPPDPCRTSPQADPRRCRPGRGTRRHRLHRLRPLRPADGCDRRRRREERRRLGGTVLAVLTGPRRGRRPVAWRVATRRERRRRVGAGRAAGRTVHRRHRLLTRRLVVRRRIGLVVDQLGGAGGRGLATGPVLERRTDRERRRQAVRLLVRERRAAPGAARRSSGGGGRAPVRPRVAIVLEGDEGTRGSAVDDREPAVGHRRRMITGRARGDRETGQAPARRPKGPVRVVHPGQGGYRLAWRRLRCGRQSRQVMWSALSVHEPKDVALRVGEPRVP